MIDFSQARIISLAVHKVGNKSHDDGYTATTALYPSDEQLEGVLLRYFLTPFKGEEYYHFVHDAEVNLNEMYTYAQTIFGSYDQETEEPEAICLKTSVHILQHLYDQSVNPNIKPGELYVVYLADCIIDDELTDALGIFKSENRDTYLHFRDDSDPDMKFGTISFKAEDGVNINKLDKGAVIFNSSAENGYVVTLVGASSAEAQYWKNDFLRVERLKNNGFFTEAYMELCREFSQDIFLAPEKTEKIAFLNKSIDFFQSNETFEPELFAATVLDKDEEKRAKFEHYRKTFEEERGLPMNNEEGFMISESAVKVAKRKFKSLIKLDTEMEIKLSPNNPNVEEYIERGYDEEKGMYFYRLFFNEEKG